MVKRIGPILAGLAAFVVVEALASLVARAVWPAYDLAVPTRAFTLDMLLVRQAAGMVCSVAAGAAAAWVSNGDKQRVLETALVLLLLSVLHHLSIWDHYPVWYHLFFFSYIVPCAVLGGNLRTSQERSA